MFDTEDYQYDLPAGLIAQIPAKKRDASRLLVVDRARASFSDCFFSDLPRFMKPGDLLIVNDTRVVPARLMARKESGGRVEVLILNPTEAIEEGPCTRTCLLKSSKRPKNGSRLFFDLGVIGQIKHIRQDGLVAIAFSGEKPVDALMEMTGHVPLPPYIKRESEDARAQLDRERYQTVYARNRGAVAAPTAGLHFTEALLSTIRKKGVSIAYVTLHVGYGTFSPVRVKDIRQHRVGTEHFNIHEGVAEAVAETRKNRGRVIAVGTTVVRALETAAREAGLITPGHGKTDLLITPGFSFQVVDAMITNFHLPKSSLLFLVSAFSGWELVKKAYLHAVKKRYRFYSYGDAMFIA
jgi:S-adenosylmethionine:tRNA ribosyltransferase-isomerase